MSCILHIDTSTNICSTALSEDSHVFFHEEHRSEAMGSSSEKIGEMVDAALSFADSHAMPLDAVAVSSGPGSYTGLRIGVSMAKGLCFGRDLKLIAVPTLELMAVPVLLKRPDLEEDALLCPMIDARRMEVYAAVFNRRLDYIRPTGADIVESSTYEELLEAHPVYFFGNGAAKCRDVISHPNARFIEDIEPQARFMQPLAEKRLLRGETEDVAYFVPHYLKEYVAKLPSNPIIQTRK